MTLRRLSRFLSLLPLLAGASLVRCVFHEPSAPQHFTCSPEDRPACPEGMDCVERACVDRSQGRTPCGAEFVASPDSWFDSFERPTCDELRDAGTVRWKVAAVYQGVYEDFGPAFASSAVSASGRSSCAIAPPKGTAQLNDYYFTDQSGEDGYVFRPLHGRVCISARARLASGEPRTGLELVLRVIRTDGGSETNLRLRADQQDVYDDGWTTFRVEALFEPEGFVDVRLGPVTRTETSFLVDDFFIGAAP